MSSSRPDRDSMSSNPAEGTAARNSRSPLHDVTNRLHNESLQHLHEQTKRKSYKAPEVAAAMGRGPVDADQSDARAQLSTLVIPPYDGPVPVVSEHTLAVTDHSKGGAVTSPREATFNSRNSDGHKTHIGPWQLGKTLGSGSAAMVRLCRHRVTQELAAVKIVSKSPSQLVQAGSIYTLDRIDNKLPERINGERRIPVAIEREVAILKLIQHPNIMKLYDIWENSKEM
jgi:serine/threonine-protein kinase HSL1 (negative regulator of Swe1 kinase)